MCMYLRVLPGVYTLRATKERANHITPHSFNVTAQYGTQLEFCKIYDLVTTVPLRIASFSGCNVIVYYMNISFV
jgi:hypothetical protein